MGCKIRISSGLNWVFEHTDRAIILEDDCLPHPQFFRFCDEILDKYATSPEVMSICGTKTYPGDVSGGSDYFFSRYNNCWGWATWKRAWSEYDDRFIDYSTIDVFTILRDYLGSSRAAAYWYYILRMVLHGKISSWAYCWMITCFFRKGFHVYPKTNMVVNSGFGHEATHTKNPTPYMPQCYGDVLSLPMSNPQNIVYYDKADQWIEDNMYSKSLSVRLQWVLSKFRQHF